MSYENVPKNAAETKVLVEDEVLLTAQTPAGRLNVETTNLSERLGDEGTSWVGSSTRLAVSLPDTFSSVLTAGSKNLLIEEFIIGLDFANATSGSLHIEVRAYVETSNGNSWTYTPNAPGPTGRATNAAFINSFSESTADLGVNVLTLTGSSDYLVFFSDFFIDTAGNRYTKSSEIKSFFEGLRKISIPPNTKLLVETIITGSASGTVDINSIFFTAESST